MDFLSCMVPSKNKIKNTIKSHFFLWGIIPNTSQWHKHMEAKDIINQLIHMIDKKVFLQGSTKKTHKNKKLLVINSLISLPDWTFHKSHVSLLCVSQGARVNLSARLCATIAEAGVFTVSVGDALLGLFGDSLLVMHERTARHAPIISLWYKTANSASLQPTRRSKTLSPRSRSDKWLVLSGYM